MTKYLMRVAILVGAIGLLAPSAVVAAPASADRLARPSGVDLVYLRAVLKKTTPRRTCVVTWRTGVESNLVGFNLYRVVKGKQTKLTRAIVPAKGAAGGATYKYTDKLPKTLKGAAYRLEALGLDARKVSLGSRVCGKAPAPVL